MESTWEDAAQSLAGGECGNLGVPALQCSLTQGLHQVPYLSDPGKAASSRLCRPLLGERIDW